MCFSYADCISDTDPRITVSMLYRPRDPAATVAHSSAQIRFVPNH